ncbi:MAG: ABC transporter ATP-binding protein [Dehalococcoidia bacterium]|nr:MAG: ABC transporter ATP-binding protein [Dehalococcoidia bacterium]
MVINVEHLVKSYGDIQAVNDINFQVRQGEAFGMLGPNGAGKTTTVEIIEGLRQADSGSVSVLGLDVAKVPAKIKQRIGIQLQAPSLLPLVTVREILQLFAGFYKQSIPVDDILELLALRESQKILVKNLSGGQQQRLSVAMALINNPDIAFLDEPTTGLDPQARRSLWSVIKDMRSKGKTIFLTTHYMEEAERLCDRVAIIDHGQIIAMDSPRELINTHFKESAIQFELEPAPPEVVLQTFPGTTQVMVSKNEVIVYSDNIPATMSAILKYAEKVNLTDQLKDLYVREATLEDVFLKLTGRKIRE